MIGSNKSRFKRAAKKYHSNHNKKYGTIHQTDENQKAINESLSQNELSYIRAGTLYYSKDKRMELADAAERLRYSDKAVREIREIDDSKWNMDYVTAEKISNLEKIEEDVNSLKPNWEKSIFSKIGQEFNYGKRYGDNM